MNIPLKPDESECCGSGCNPCIFDIYDEQLKKYNKPNKSSTKTENNCISLTSYTIFKITNIEQDSCETFLYTFEYLRRNKPEQTTLEENLFFKPGQHFLLRGEDDKLENKYFTRAYTPIANKNNCFTVLIKFYEDGLMSKYLRNLEMDSETYWRGPYGSYKINYKLKNVLMVSQGTGIAPIFSIINEYINNENCETFIKLFYCCKNVDNIHLRKQIYKLSSNWNFTYEIFLSRNNQELNKKYNEVINCRRLDQNDFIKYFENKTENYQILICGTEIFNTNINDFIVHLKVNKELIYIF